MINRAGGSPLQAFCRSSITFTSALLLSSKFYPYVRVALRDKVLAPPRLNVADLSLFESYLPDHVERILWLAPVSPVVFFCRRGGGKFIYFPISGRRIAVIYKISQTNNMSGSWCFPSNKIFPLAVLPKPQPVRRSPWQVLACYDLLVAVFKALPVHPYVRRSSFISA